ncbi:MAG: hypothetical protein U0136_15280 [Bdellovibrionota bacterium]
MTISDTAPVASVPTEFNVKVAKGQDQQHETVVNELLQSVRQNVNAENGVGQQVNVAA